MAVFAVRAPLRLPLNAVMAALADVQMVSASGGLALVQTQSNDPKPVSVALTGTRTIGIGPGQTYATPGAFDWGTLQAGDVVNIWPNTGGAAWPWKLGIRAQGTEAAPIIINGVTAADGTRPIFDFAGATTAPCTGVFTATPAYGESLGGIVIKRGSSDDYYTYKPKWLQIRNLELRGARNGASYTALNGSSYAYSSAGALYCLVVADLIVENCILTDSGFGLFVMAKDGLLSQACERITLRNSRIYGNGVSGSYLEHGVYMQCDSPIVEGCYIGPLRSGAQGSSYKDRSARLIMRHNDVVAHARALDLVYSEEQASGIAALSYYGQDYVYGNRIKSNVYEGIHYGGDNLGEQDSSSTVFVPTSPYRARLFFWGNEVDYTSTEYRADAFGLSLASTIAEIWNNKLTFGGVTEMTLLEYAGIARLYNNEVVGSVALSGRSDAYAGHISITNTSGRPTDDAFLNALLAG